MYLAGSPSGDGEEAEEETESGVGWCVGSGVGWYVGSGVGWYVGSGVGWSSKSNSTSSLLELLPLPPLSPSANNSPSSSALARGISPPSRAGSCAVVAELGGLPRNVGRDRGGSGTQHL